MKKLLSFLLLVITCSFSPDISNKLEVPIRAHCEKLMGHLETFNILSVDTLTEKARLHFHSTVMADSAEVCMKALDSFRALQIRVTKESKRYPKDREYAALRKTIAENVGRYEQLLRGLLSRGEILQNELATADDAHFSGFVTKSAIAYYYTENARWLVHDTALVLLDGNMQVIPKERW